MFNYVGNIFTQFGEGKAIYAAKKIPYATINRWHLCEFQAYSFKDTLYINDLLKTMRLFSIYTELKKYFSQVVLLKVRKIKNAVHLDCYISQKFNVFFGG